VPGELILDTGPFVALVDRSEARPRDCDLGTDRIFTLDRRDFSIFRVDGVRPFRLLP
jgi:hypothetical protein